MHILAVVQLRDQLRGQADREVLRAFWPVAGSKARTSPVAGASVRTVGRAMVQSTPLAADRVLSGHGVRVGRVSLGDVPSRRTVVVSRVVDGGGDLVSGGLRLLDPV